MRERLGVARGQGTQPPCVLTAAQSTQNQPERDPHQAVHSH